MIKAIKKLYNKKQKAKCNDRLCPKMKYALVKQKGVDECVIL